MKRVVARQVLLTFDTVCKRPQESKTRLHGRENPSSDLVFLELDVVHDNRFIMVFLKLRLVGGKALCSDRSTVIH